MSDDFTITYDLYQSAILRYCTWKSRDAEIGHDLTQETFLKYFQCLEKKQEILHTRAFLYRIAHNLFVNHVRRKKESSLDELLETGFEPAVDHWHLTNSRLDAEKPLKALASMKGPHRNVLHQRFIRGLGPSEIGKLTGESSNTVSVRIFRGLKHLRVLLDESGDSLTSDTSRQRPRFDRRPYRS